MKLRNCARLLLAVTPWLAGCGDFWQAPNTSTTGTTNTTLSSGFFYVINQGTSQIVAYDISSGTLQQIGAYTLAAAPTALAVAPGNGYLYVSSIAGIYLYTIGSTGALTIGHSGQAISGDPASAIEVDSSGNWLVDVAGGTSGVIVDAIPIDSSTGLPSGGALGTEQYTVNNASGAVISVNEMAISGDDDYVFMALGTSGTLVVPFTTGNANPLAPPSRVYSINVANTGGAALSVAVDPSTTPRLLYIGETLANPAGTSGGLRVINYSSLGGTLTQATGSPIASGGTAPHAILPIASGDYVYVGNGTGPSTAGNITGFSITGSASPYTVALGSTVAAGVQPYGLAEDSQANFVLAVSEGGSYDLEAYIFDTTTAGQLDLSIKSTTGTDPTQAVGVAATNP